MPLLDSNMWSGTDPRLQQQSMGGMGPGMGAGQGVPQLPPTLAAQLMQRSQMRGSPQGNPLMAALSQPRPQGMDMMPPFQPSSMPKPKEFWEQQFQPTEGMRSNSMMGAMPSEAGVGMPGQLPQPGGPQIPDNMQGMGLGATAPQMMGGGGFNPSAYASSLQAGGGVNPNVQGMAGAPGGEQTEDPMSKLRSQMFGAYLNLYPEGNL
jgi:hypothetical protein